MLKCNQFKINISQYILNLQLKEGVTILRSLFQIFARLSKFDSFKKNINYLSDLIIQLKCLNQYPF